MIRRRSKIEDKEGLEYKIAAALRCTRDCKYRGAAVERVEV